MNDKPLLDHEIEYALNNIGKGIRRFGKSDAFQYCWLDNLRVGSRYREKGVVYYGVQEDPTGPSIDDSFLFESDRSETHSKAWEC